MHLMIRPIKPEDRQTWQTLYFEYLEFYESEPHPTGLEILWERLSAPEPKIQSLVAELNGQVIAFAHFHFQLSTWTHSTHCYLEDLFVSPVSRSKGVATELINAVKKSALDNHCSEMYWITKSNNQTARKLYDKLAKLSDFVRYEILLED